MDNYKLNRLAERLEREDWDAGERGESAPAMSAPSVAASAARGVLPLIRHDSLRPACERAVSLAESVGRGERVDRAAILRAAEGATAVARAARAFGDARAASAADAAAWAATSASAAMADSAAGAARSADVAAWAVWAADDAARVAA